MVKKLGERIPNMEDALSLADVLGVLRRRFWIVVLVVFVAVSLATLLSYVVLPPIYQADTSLIVNERPSAVQGTGGVDYGQIETNRSLAVTYARIIASRAILQDTIDTLGLPETIKQLTKVTTVQVQGQTEIIAVRVTDRSAARAAIIANAIAKSFIAQLPVLVNRVENVSVIDRAVPVNDQVSPRPVLNIAVALVAALMLGFLLAFLVDYFDDVVKAPDDIKKLFGLRVLAVVPDIESEEAHHGNAY
jgi:capsular polysaccharide biosynthesis protein